MVVVGGPATSGWPGRLRSRVGLSGTRAGCGGFLGEVGFYVRCGGPPVAFDATRAGSASARGPWRTLGAACGVTRARVDSADAPPRGITTVWRNGPVGVLRHVIGDTIPRGRSAGAAAAGPKGPVTVVWRIISTDTLPPGIAAAGGSDPVTVLRRTISDTIGRDRPATVRRNGPVGVLRWRGWCRGARWG
ncbi:hypothetical protein OOK27_02085 [Streptomyces canus]|uniref:hypothetical protein n=1 Tax=Streptomyces canus TaxID=58343 RepID=UPI002259FC32|nr:hypothetical protein [Streptomyces canus]MCX5252965.1 hypothetical protein [Streptomyces canus]